MAALISDEQLVARAAALHRRLAIRHLNARGVPVTKRTLGRELKKTVSVFYGETATGRPIRIVTVTDSTYYRYLEEFGQEILLPGETLGSRNTSFYWVDDGKRKRNAIHAEQLGANDARARGAVRGRLATSNPTCEVCASLGDEFQEFQFVNTRRADTTKDLRRRTYYEGPTAPGRAARPTPSTLPIEDARLTTARAAEMTEARARVLAMDSRIADKELRHLATDKLPHWARPLSARSSAAVATDVAEATASRWRIALSTAGTLVRSLLRAALAVLKVVAVEAVFFVLDVRMVLAERRRSTAMNDAIERAVRAQLPRHLSNLLLLHGSDLAEFFLAHWGRPSELFLYFSPLLAVRAQPATSNEEYSFETEFDAAAKLTQHSISRSRLDATLEEIDPMWTTYHAHLRWSAPYPLLTPFDAYLAYLDVVGELFTKSWLGAEWRKAVPAATRERLLRVCEHLSTVAAWLGDDAFAGCDGTEPFDKDRAAQDRTDAIRNISDLIDKTLGPLVKDLEREGVLDADFIDVRGAAPAIQGRIRDLLTVELSISQYIDRLASDLNSLPRKSLRYQRRHRATMTERSVAFDRKRAEMQDQLTAMVSEYLPKRARSQGTRWSEYRPSGVVVLETADR